MKNVQYLWSLETRHRFYGMNFPLLCYWGNKPFCGCRHTNRELRQLTASAAPRVVFTNDMNPLESSLLGYTSKYTSGVVRQYYEKLKRDVVSFSQRVDGSILERRAIRNRVITSAKGGYVFSRVCFSVRLSEGLHTSKERICVSILPEVRLGWEIKYCSYSSVVDCHNVWSLGKGM